MTDSFTLIGFIFLCLGMTVVGFLFKNPPILILAGLAWIGFGAWGMSITDITMHIVMPTLGFATGFVCIAYYPVVSARVKRETIRHQRNITDEESYYNELHQMKEGLRKAGGGRGRR